MCTKRKPNILVIGNLHNHPSAKAFLEKFVRIIKEVSDKTYVISGDSPPAYENVSWIKLRIAPGGNLLRRLFIFIKTQIYLLWLIARNRLYYDMAIVLGIPFVLPTVFLRIVRKKVAVFVAQKPNNPVMRFLCRLNFVLSNLLVVEANNVVTDWKIRQYSRKVANASIYVDMDLFKKEEEISEREQIVGYIGSLEERKGIKELVEAISIINKTMGTQIGFIIGGCGCLEFLVKEISLDNSNVEFKGLIPHRDLPAFYNRMKLLVLPSYSEGLPNVILEAMACGTPVLATPVGAIRDVIKDGETGFIMKDNSPESIAENVIRALNHPDLERIAENAHALVEREFTYEKVVERWKELLKTI